MPTTRAFQIVAFDEAGEFIGRSGFDSLLASVETGRPLTDLLIFSHGWKNNLEDASGLYEELLAQLENVAVANPGLRAVGYRALVLGVVWPAKAWDKAANTGEESVFSDPLDESVYEVLSPDRASPAGFRHDVVRIQQFLLADRISGVARDEFLSLLRRHADVPTLAEDESIFEPEAPAEALEGLAFEGFSARDVFRTFTYWQMKKRSGVIGQVGVRAILAAVQGRFPSASVHLIGHSFGCKVMLAAAAGPGVPAPKPVQTLVLLQGALSFEAMAARVGGTAQAGGYRAALDPSRVDGPIVATYSRLDEACGRAYPLASRVAGQVGELEGLLDRYRALGSVGASGVGEGLEHQVAMRDVGSPYGFSGRGVWSVNGGDPPSAFITGHGAIRTPQVAWLILSALARR